MSNNPVIPLDIDTTAGTAKAKALKNDVDQVDEEIDKSKAKLSAYWQYGNQITSILLTQLARAAEGTKAQAAIQLMTNAAAKIQAEYSIIQTGLMSQAAFVSGNIPSSILLGTIAAGMQSLVIQQIVNEQQIKQAKKSAAELARQLKSYQ